jgi:signal peptidase II
MTSTPEAGGDQHAPSALRWLWLSALVIAADQASKALIVAHLQLFERRELLPVLEITRLHNRGAAFSMLSTASGWQQYLFIGLAVVVSVGIVVWLQRVALARATLLGSGLALILGGALGNVIDRLLREHVIDFIHFHWFDSWSFPAFNLADTAITIGAALVILDSLLDSRRTRSVAAPPP